jgi:hypothetical protein
MLFSGLKVEKEWVGRCFRKDKWDPKNKRICNKYFVLEDFEDAMQAQFFFYVDAPHLLKLLRNWLFDRGFQLPNGQTIIKAPLVKLVEDRNSEVYSSHKLTMLHVTCQNTERQNVALAAQLLLNTANTAVLRYLPGEDKNLAHNVDNFINLVSKWFIQHIFTNCFHSNKNSMWEKTTRTEGFTS